MSRKQRRGGPKKLLEMGLPHLLDERSNPDFRTVYGTLLHRSSGLDAAISRMRLSAVDLTPDELRGVGEIRVLLAEVNAMTLRADAEASLADPGKADNLRNLIRLLDEGRISVRSAPLAGWAPDFSVFRRSGSPWSVLVGLHWFGRPYPHDGPALASLHGKAAAGRVARRFEIHWRRAHDIGAAVLHILEDARSEPTGVDDHPRPAPTAPAAAPAATPAADQGAAVRPPRWRAARSSTGTKSP